MANNLVNIQYTGAEIAAPIRASRSSWPRLNGGGCCCPCRHASSHHSSNDHRLNLGLGLAGLRPSDLAVWACPPAGDRHRHGLWRGDRRGTRWHSHIRWGQPLLFVRLPRDRRARRRVRDAVRALLSHHRSAGPEGEGRRDPRLLGDERTGDRAAPPLRDPPQRHHDEPERVPAVTAGQDQQTQDGRPMGRPSRSRDGAEVRRVPRGVPRAVRHSHHRAG